MITEKSEFLDRRLRLNVTYFNMDYEDKQLTVTTSPICNNRCTTNVGSAKIDGWEIESVWQATEALQLHANIGLLDAKWDEITNPAAGVTGDSNFARAPDSSANLGGRYDWALNNGSGISFMLDYSYRDDQESSGQNSTTLTIPSYSLWTARIKYVSNEGDLEIGVFCTNCADEEYITGGAAWGVATDNTQFSYKQSTVHPAYVTGGLNPWGVAPPGITMVNVGAPRIYGVDLRYNF